jgi:hypothetical protein
VSEVPVGPVLLAALPPADVGRPEPRQAPGSPLPQAPAARVGSNVSLCVLVSVLRVDVCECGCVYGCTCATVVVVLTLCGVLPVSCQPDFSVCALDVPMCSLCVLCLRVCASVRPLPWARAPLLPRPSLPACILLACVTMYLRPLPLPSDPNAPHLCQCASR